MSDINNTQLGAGRPTLQQLFNDRQVSKKVRNQAIIPAYRDHKYTLRYIAGYLNMNPNYLCKIIKS